MLPKDIFKRHIHIGLDLDETLASTVDGMLAHAHSIWELKVCQCFDDICAYDLCSIDPTLSPERARNIWEWYGKSTMDPLSVPIVPDSKKWIELLIQNGNILSIITARSNEDSWKVERTKAWVETHFQEIGESRISFVNHFSSESRPKSHACLDHGVTLMIDDSIENAIDLAGAWIATILLEKPWNRSHDFMHPLLYRAKNWKEIVDNLSADA